MTLDELKKADYYHYMGEEEHPLDNACIDALKKVARKFAPNSPDAVWMGWSGDTRQNRFMELTDLSDADKDKNPDKDNRKFFILRYCDMCDAVNEATRTLIDQGWIDDDCTIDKDTEEAAIEELTEKFLTFVEQTSLNELRNSMTEDYHNSPKKYTLVYSKDPDSEYEELTYDACEDTEVIGALMQLGFPYDASKVPTFATVYMRRHVAEEFCRPYIGPDGIWRTSKDGYRAMYEDKEIDLADFVKHGACKGAYDLNKFLKELFRNNEFRNLHAIKQNDEIIVENEQE